MSTLPNISIFCENKNATTHKPIPVCRNERENTTVVCSRHSYPAQSQSRDIDITKQEKDSNMIQYLCRVPQKYILLSSQQFTPQHSRSC